MTDLAALARWSATHHGVVTNPQLHRLGLTTSHIKTLRAQGALVPVQRGLHLVAAVPGSYLQTVAVACAATTGAASHTTAVRVWVIRCAPTDARTHVTVPLARRLRQAPNTDVVVHRSAALPARDLVRRADGIVVTSPPRTLFDMAALVDRLSLESMIEQAIEREMCSIPTLLGVADRLARPGRAGSGRFIAVLASRPAWRKPVDSHDELLLEHALMRAGLPRPVRQHPVTLRTGKDVHPDLAWPDIRLAVEVDHHSWHTSAAAVAYDKRRDRQVRLVGWDVERVTDEDIRQRLSTTIDEIRARYTALSAGRSLAA